MFGKAIAILLSFGIMATALLATRQKRYEVASKISRSHWRLMEQQRDLMRSRALVATKVRPDAIRLALNSMNIKWRPIPHRLDAPAPPTQPRLATKPGVKDAEAIPVEFGG
ncbi:MAG: hypothetical protein EXS12_07160 [Phycisphaerales bacterium]|nr:hypothetical protein [Phycisphaerales bacterium]